MGSGQKRRGFRAIQSIILTTAGCLLLAGALGLVLYNLYEDQLAGKSSLKILDEIDPDRAVSGGDKAQEERGRNTKTTLGDAGKMNVDENGEVTIPTEIIVGKEQQIFGEKVYGTLDEIKDSIEIPVTTESMDNVLAAIDNVGENLKAAVEENVIKPASEHYELTQSQTNRLVKESQKEMATKMEKIKGDYEQQRKIAEVKLQETLQQATNQKEIDEGHKSSKRCH